jgi:predicted cupin superfamily sugar epimerase
LNADALIAALRLQPHPEGGHYRETFRDEGSTAIYFLLRRGESSHWHRVLDAAEGWHLYAGAPLELRVSLDGRTVETIVLGPGQPQFIVPRAAWQAARSLGDFSLCGCTVAPPFQFGNFELAPQGWQPG